MSLSASRRTWEEASSPAAVRLAREYEQAWRESLEAGRRPDPQAFLAGTMTSVDGAGARLALLRADLSLRWEAGEKVGARWYLDHHADLSEDTIVALIYEEFCLLEDDDERPDPAEFLARYPQVSAALRRVLDIHGLVGSGTSVAGSLMAGNGSGEHACAFPETGQTIAGFSLVEELGRGAFARVFLARERELADRPVALKVTRRGSREPQTLARLQHTHIVPVHSHRIDKATGLHLLCMPYFGRTTLAGVLAHAGRPRVHNGAGLVELLDRLEPCEQEAGVSSGRAALECRTFGQAIAWWGARLAEALAHAHERGVLHRDIKPSNVLVTSDAMPMLLDFNLAREPLDDSGSAAETAPGGTVDYMAPEHLRALAHGDPEGLDHRSDIYSLGVVLYEALTGARPFATPRRGASLSEALLRAADDRSRGAMAPRASNPEVSPALDTIVRRCLAPDPGGRYDSAAELAHDLQAAADDLPLAYAREPWTSRAGGWIRRRRKKLVVAAALCSALLIVTVTVLAASLGWFLIKLEDSKLVETEVNRGSLALKAQDYAAAFAHFEAAQELASHFDRLDMRKYRPSERGFGDTIRTIFTRLGTLHAGHDLDELKATARDKGDFARIHARVRADADALHQAADRLCFRLLLEPDELPAIIVELEDAFAPFFIMNEENDWTRQYYLELLDAQYRARLEEEVNALLFLRLSTEDKKWLSPADGEPADRDRDRKRRAIADDALRICNHALKFVTPREPWLALRTRLECSRARIGSRGAAAGVDRDPFAGEPRDIAGEKSAMASFQWGLLEFGAGDKARAIDWMRHAVRLRGDDYWYQFVLAFVLDQAGLLDEALVHYSIAAALQPASPWVRYSRARLYRSKGMWQRALDDFAVALREFRGRPEERTIRLEQGYLFQTMGRFADARREYDEVIKGEAGDKLGRAARLNRANIDADSGEYARASREYGNLILSDLSDTAARQSRAILELRRGDAASAERDLAALLQMDRIEPRDRIEYLSERVQALLMLGRASEALADAVELRRIHPCPAHERLAQRTFLASRRHDLLQIERPEDIALLPLRGRRLDAELRAAAAELGRTAAGRGPSAFRAGLTRAAILAALKDWRGALAAADRSVALSGALATEARLTRARVLAAAGQRGRAAEEIRDALAIHPDEPGLLACRGDLRLAAGDPRGAVEDYTRALSQGTRDAILRGRASALVALGNYQAALDQWSLALRRDPELPEAYLGRARTYFLLRQWDQGAADLEQAASWGQGDPAIEAAVALAYLESLPYGDHRLPRFVIHLGRAVEDFWHSLEDRPQLAAGRD